MVRVADLGTLIVLLAALLACRSGAGGCKSNADCPANTFCNAGQCVAPPAPAPAPAPTAAAVASAAPVSPKTVSVGGLELGSHACTMQDGTGAYNRICAVSQQQDGSLGVKTRAGRLNRTIGFEFAATGGPESYGIKGKMTAFDSCSGSYATTLAKESIGGSDWYVAKFKHCKIMMRVETL